MHAGIGLAAQIIIGLQEDLEKSREIFFTELRSRFGEGRALIRGRGDQIRIRAAHARDQKVADVADGFAAEMLEVASIFLKGVHEAESAVRRTFRDGRDKFVERIFRNDAEKFANLLVRDDIAAIGSRLLEKRERIAQAAFGHAGDHGEGARFDLQIFFFRDLFEAASNFGEGQRAKMKVLGRANGSCRRDLPAASWP